MRADKLDDVAAHYGSHDASAELESAHEVGGTADDANRMSGYSVRLPAAVLNDVRELAQLRGLTTGAYLRELIEAGVIRAKSSDITVPVDVLLAAVERYQHRKAS